MKALSELAISIPASVTLAVSDKANALKAACYGLLIRLLHRKAGDEWPPPALPRPSPFPRWRRPAAAATW